MVPRGTNCREVDSGWRSLPLPGSVLRDGIYTDGRRQVTLTGFDGTVFSFDSPTGFSAVLVHGAESTALWSFETPVTAATGLHAPGDVPIASMGFCFSVETT